jgi:hypothetical protein
VKKLIIAVSLLVLWAGNATAAGNDKKDSNPQATEQSILASSSALTTTVTLLLEENFRLRNETDLLQKKVDDLSNSLDYSKMMHSSITALQAVVEQREAEELNSKLSYMQMMHVTLMNISKILVESK